MKEGKGLLIIKTIIEDNFDDLMENDPQATLEIQKMVNEYVKAQDIKTIDTSTIVRTVKFDINYFFVLGLGTPCERCSHDSPSNRRLGSSS